MTVTGLLTCLGFPGWCPLQLLIPGDADPAAFARRLRQAQAGATCPPPALLLAALLRSQRDLTPLRSWSRLHPFPTVGPIRFHYRLVCRTGSVSPLRITVWERSDEQQQQWCLRSGPLPVGEFLGRLDPQPHSRLCA